MHLKQREEVICDYLRQAFWNYSCKLKRDYLIFLKYRTIRMEELKRNIAILTVKKFWKAKKLSIKILREKLIRIKRRKAAMQNKEAFQKYLSTLNGANNQAKKETVKKADSKESLDGNKEEEKTDENKDPDENPEEDLEYKEAQRIKNAIERKIKEKVKKSKLAYAIDTSAVKVVLPMMQEKALNEGLDNDSIQTKLFYITASVFAKGRNLSREPPETSRNYQLDSPRSCSQRRHYEGRTLPPLSLITAAEAPLESATRFQVKSVESEHFLSSTVCSINRTEPPIIPEWKQRYETRRETKPRRRKFTMKTRTDKTVREFKIPERVNRWIPVARRFSNYVPGIDNAGYVPHKWTPLKLDRRILSTAEHKEI